MPIWVWRARNNSGSCGRRHAETYIKNWGDMPLVGGLRTTPMRIGPPLFAEMRKLHKAGTLPLIPERKCRGPPHLHRQPLCSCRNADDVGADLLSVSPRMGPGMRAPRSQPPDYRGPGRPSLAATRASLRYRWPSQFLISFPLQWVSMISIPEGLCVTSIPSLLYSP